MIRDNTLVFSDAQAITVTAPSTNVIDRGATGTPYGYSSPMIRDLGRDEDHADLSVSVVTTFAGLTSLQVSFQTSPDNATWSDVELGPVIPLATLIAGYPMRIPNKIPQGASGRYFRLNYVVVGTATAGAITAAFVASRQNNFSILGA